jgi:hypothetical protein
VPELKRWPTTIRTITCFAGVAALSAGCGSSESTQGDASSSETFITTTTPETSIVEPLETPPLSPAPDQLPYGFPRGVPIANLPYLSGVGADGVFILRFTSTDATADIAAYQKRLEGSGLMITGVVDALAGQQHSLTVTAMADGVHVEANAYGRDAQDGGNYMEVIVETL